MNDITMCVNKDCPRKLECYRYMAVPDDYWQSQQDFSDSCNELNDYECFYEIDNKPIREIK
jgi:hypothetical protein